MEEGLSTWCSGRVIYELPLSSSNEVRYLEDNNKNRETEDVPFL